MYVCTYDCLHACILVHMCMYAHVHVHICRHHLRRHLNDSSHRLPDITQLSESSSSDPLEKDSNGLVRRAVLLACRRIRTSQTLGSVPPYKNPFDGHVSLTCWLSPQMLAMRDLARLLQRSEDSSCGILCISGRVPREDEIHTRPKGRQKIRIPRVINIPKPDYSACIFGDVVVLSYYHISVVSYHVIITSDRPTQPSCSSISANLPALDRPSSSST